MTACLFCKRADVPCVPLMVDVLVAHVDIKGTPCPSSTSLGDDYPHAELMTDNPSWALPGSYTHATKVKRKS